MRIYYTPEQHAARRKRAVELVEKGWLQTDIAEAMGVSNGAVSQWLKDYRENGAASFEPRYRTPRSKTFPESNYGALRELLEEGPQAHGYADGLWTGDRVRKLIGEEFGIKVSKRTSYRILADLNYSSQKPEHRASERDQQQRDRWESEELPRIKKMLRSRGDGHYR